MKTYQPAIGLLLLTLITLTFSSCEEYVPYPRPFGFHRIDMPAETSHEKFSNTTCPFTFEYPDFGEITRDMPDSCWVDISFPDYDCKWHLTYRQVSPGKDRHYHFEDYRRLIYKHTKKALQIKESPIAVPGGEGILFEIYGNVGTPAQVFLYDSSEKHIMMMSFYLNTALRNDSLQPVIDYMKGEVGHMLQSVSWE